MVSVIQLVDLAGSKSIHDEVRLNLFAGCVTCVMELCLINR